MTHTSLCAAQSLINQLAFTQHKLQLPTVQLARHIMSLCLSQSQITCGPQFDSGRNTWDTRRTVDVRGGESGGGFLVLL